MENLTELICTFINTIFSKIFSSIDYIVYSNLDNILFINPNIISSDNLEQILGTNSKNGLLLLANSLIFGIILFYSFKFVISHLIYTTTDSPYQFIFKCIIFVACINSSLFICEKIIQLFSIVTDFICEIGYSIFGKQICFSNLIDSFNSTLYSNQQSFDIFSVDGILKVITEIVIVYILIAYSVRYIICKILILLSPFAFLSLISTSFDGFFKGWSIQFLILMFSQVLISLVLVIGFSITISAENILSKISFLALLIVIAKCKTTSKSLFQNIHNYSTTNKKYFI